MSNDKLAPSVTKVVNQVRQRTRLQNMTSGSTAGVVAGGVLAIALAAVDAFATPIAWYWLAVAVAGCAAVGGAIGMLVPVSFAAAAQRIDSYYAMKDRIITALEFESNDDPVRQMQVADARQHLRQVRSEDCVQIHHNRPALLSSGAMAIVAFGILFFVESRRVEPTIDAPLAIAVQQASMLRETMLPELEEVRDLATENPELDELAKKLEEIVEELETEAIDETDMMAKLSEMEQAIAEMQSAMQLEMTAAQMKNLSEAMMSSEAMKRAAAAMQEEKYEEASEKLEAIDPSSMTDKERRAVSDDMKKFLSKLSPGQKGKLSEAVGEIQEGLEKKNDGQCKDGLCKLAGLCKSQGNCKKIGQCMACQLNRLAQCKSECRGACEKNGGDKVAKSESPSQSWGKGASGNPNDGKATDLQASRREEQLSSVQGDGPSESEVIEAPEGEQSAARAFAQRYQKFRSQAEAVLDTEPLPLGHRETVRQYFENIRPDKESVTEL